jgi:UDP:flavonoid glycosyltransferase YjiC (YdhE family)
MQYSTKPLLLIFPFGYLSHYLRCIVLARQLSNHFEIKFAANTQYDGYVQDAGFDVFPCASMNEADVLSAVKNFDFSWLNEKNLEHAFLAQVAAIEAYRPVAVLGDAMPTLKMAAEYTDTYFISLLNGYMSKHYAQVRSLSKTHFAYPYLSKLPAAVKDFFTATGETLAFREVHKPFKKLRSRYKLSTINSYLDEMEGNHTLICDLPSLFPQKNLPRNYSIIGPLIYDEKRTSSVLNLATNKRTIYVSAGSTGQWQQLTFLNHPDFARFNIVTAGDRQNVLSAMHIIKLNFVSANELLPHTDLVICHGGNGTIYQALAYGVPLLCSPAHFEQEWNVAALETAGIGRSLYGVEGLSNYNALIDEWVNKKHLPVYSEIKEQIAITNSSPSVFEDVVNSILQEQLAV